MRPSTEAPPLSPHALCRDHPEISWDQPGRSGPGVEAAKAVCHGCPLCRECAAYAVADPSLLGIWGGTTEHERARLRRHPSTTAAGRPDTPLANVAASDHPPASPAPAATVPEPRPPVAENPRAAAEETAPTMPTEKTETNTAAGETTERGKRTRATRAVTRYLDSLTGQAPAPRPSRRTVETELAKIDQRLAKPELTSARRLKLLQDRRDLQTHGLPARGRPLGESLLDGFLAHAADYARDHQISYEAFLDFGVAAEVLDKADLHPSDDPDLDDHPPS